MTSVLLPLFATALAAETPAVPSPDITGLMQAWVTAYDQDTDPMADPAGYGDPEDDVGIKLRRARVGVQGKDNRLRYGLVVGVASPYDAVSAAAGVTESVQMVDAFGGYKPMKGLWLVAGLQKVPISREQLMSAANLTFTERAVSTQWTTPGRDVGALADYRFSIARVRLGAFNGNGSLFGDENAGLLFAGRTELKIGPGNSYRTYGQVKGFTLGVGLDGWQDTDTATRTLGYGGDLIVRMAGLSVLIEARAENIEPTGVDIAVPGVLSETTRQGAMAQVGYSVGALEPAFRFSVFDDATHSEDNGDVAEGLGGLTWHGLDDRVRAGAGYVLRMERGGTPQVNDTIRAWLQLAI